MNDKGYSLIELLVVIAIIAILSATALHSYQSSISDSANTDALSKIPVVRTALFQCWSKGCDASLSSVVLNSDTGAEQFYIVCDSCPIGVDVGETGFDPDIQIDIDPNPMLPHSRNTSIKVYNKRGNKTYCEFNNSDTHFPHQNFIEGHDFTTCVKNEKHRRN
jgi:prepilin-type N-terminal cleavage/methylation domain-containing protein